jgi:hypothetical protein
MITAPSFYEKITRMDEQIANEAIIRSTLTLVKIVNHHRK